MVKCLWNEKGCVWTGSIVDANNHIGSCVHGQDNDIKISIQCEEENTMLKQRNPDLENEVLGFNQQMESRVLALEGMLEYNQQMESNTLALERKVMGLSRDPRMELPILLDDDYEFGRHNVVALSQLISRYLEDVPSFIDSNRIFMCVRNCYMALEKSYNNNPEYYIEDMRMLISTCEATVYWFTIKQSKHIDDWILKQG